MLPHAEPMKRCGVCEASAVVYSAALDAWYARKCCADASHETDEPFRRCFAAVCASRAPAGQAGAQCADLRIEAARRHVLCCCARRRNGWLALPAGAVHAGRPRSTQLLRTEYCGLHSPMHRGRAPGTARIAATDARVAVARHHRAISPTTKVSIVSNTARHAKCAPIQPCMQQQQLLPPTAG